MSRRRHRPRMTGPPGFDPHPAGAFPRELSGLLRERTDDLVAEAAAMLSEARLEHYEAAGRSRVRRKLAALLETTLSCLEAGEADPIIAHTTRVARERFEAGYDLLEVQTSINVMEEVLWRRILSLVEPADIARALGLVSTLFSVGKDTLACTYVSLVAEAATRPSKDATDQGDVTAGP